MVFTRYIKKISLCYFHKIYGNIHPIDIFLPTDMTLYVSPISDIEFEFLFKDAQIRRPTYSGISAYGIAPIFTLFPAETI